MKNWFGLAIVLFSSYVNVWFLVLLWCVIEFGVTLIEYRRYRLEVISYRSRNASVLVVCDATHERDAYSVKQSKEGFVSVIRDDEFDAWSLLGGSQSVLFLIGPDSRIMQFLELEAHTRRVFSRDNSFRDNLLESAESERRLAFQRLRFWSSNVRATQLLRAFGAQDVLETEALFQRTGVIEPPFEFFDWFFLGGVSTRARRRPSELRMSHWRKLWVPRLRWEVLTPRWSYWLGPISRTAASNPTCFTHTPKALESGPPYDCWRCDFGDASLLEGFELPKRNSPFWTVGKFRLVRIEDLPCEWEAEFVLGCKATHFVEISFSQGRIPYLYGVQSNRVLEFLQSLKPGDKVTDECEWTHFCVATELFVDNASQKASVVDDSFARKGFMRFGREAYVPFPQMSALQHYFASLRKWLTIYNNPPCNTKRFNRGTRVAEGEDLSFRDEPVLRYLNIALTDFVQQVVCKEAIVNSAGHSVAVFIEHGQGFEAHTDMSPPFDVTLDLVVDHTGKDHRPVCLCPANSDSIETISCSLGESIIFRGGEVSHFGMELPEGNTHTVALLTWTFCRD